ncbi:acid phosphatase [Aspergillus sclerotialis]|uniref:Acid phosphatase n=1 Tax=Aspergillus sclerotialis TaxID=2070753 RepID=A0A3A2ZRF7_9EURO|nr:acid phosphatase [Aspergillus sclerotialis]
MITNTNSAGVFDDDDHNTGQMSIIDLFEPASWATSIISQDSRANLSTGITWKAYMEGYKPLANGKCNPYHEDEETYYVRKHNPFMSFNNIRNNTSRCQNIVNAEQHFAKDVALGRNAPQYMYYTPNMLNDAHDTNVSYASHDIRKVVNTMVDNKEFMENTLIIVTFDENDIFAEENWGTPNLIYTVLLGNDTLQCYNCQDQQFYNHFSQIVTLEKNWDLPYIPQPDGSGEGWDQWWLPFNMLRTKNDPKACAYAKCGHE